MLKPTTILIGEKADRLLRELAAENGLAAKYFYTKLIVREARAEATTLTADKLKERLQLIEEVNDELVDIINNIPQSFAKESASTSPKASYSKLWEAHRRLEKKGMSELEIHEYCLARYGMDIPAKKTPSKSPKKNPEWVGGGKVASKIKAAKKISVEYK